LISPLYANEANKPGYGQLQGGLSLKLTTHIHLVLMLGMVELYFHSTIRHHGVVLGYLIIE
jgi:hypothetical protein